MPIFFHDLGNASITDITSRSIKDKRENDIGLVVIDYLQLIRSVEQKRSREQEVAEISRQLKGLARELEIPVICVAQLNRQVEDRKTHIPKLSDLRESGAIEQDADVVLLLYREAMYKKTANKHLAEVNIAKGRNIKTDKVKMFFDGPHQVFRNWRDEE